MNEINSGSELSALYIIDCGQLLQKLEQLLLQADNQGELTDCAEAFRLLHTLKGSSAMMDFTPLAQAAHGFENVLDAVRHSKCTLSGEALRSVIDSGLSFSAYFRAELERVQTGQAPRENERVLNEIAALVASLGASPAAEVQNKTEENPAIAMPDEAERADGEQRVRVKLKRCPLPQLRASLVAKAASKLCSRLDTYPKNIEKVSGYADRIIGEGFTIGFVPLDDSSAAAVIKKISSQPYVQECTPEQTPPVPGEQPQRSELPQSITVAQSTVNELISRIGEIVTAEGALESFIEQTQPGSRQAYLLLNALKHAVADADVLAWRMSMNLMGTVFVRMQRAVRVMSKDLNKNIRVKTVGAEVQADKSVLEVLSDSLIHIVRNAADHGIESPEERMARGKSAAGLITLAAERKNDFITVTVTDDGKGIRLARVLDIAERQGKLTKARELYTGEEICRLLLTAGLSTRDEVTEYSGRGVGLDTVMRRVKSAGGELSVESTEGVGTTFRMRIPVTLCVLDGIELTVCGDNELLIPANSVMRVLSPGGYTINSDAQVEYGGGVYEQLTFPGESRGNDASGGYVLLLESEYGLFYIRARRVGMIATYYVKPMPEFVSDMMGSGYIYSGCVQSRDSSLRCILDVGRLADLMRSGNTSERYN